jgi:hypothetical protein
VTLFFDGTYSIYLPVIAIVTSFAENEEIDSVVIIFGGMNQSNLNQSQEV